MMELFISDEEMRRLENYDLSRWRKNNIETQAKDFLRSYGRHPEHVYYFNRGSMILFFETGGVIYTPYHNQVLDSSGCFFHPNREGGIEKKIGSQVFSLWKHLSLAYASIDEPSSF